jgi:hypothetical protein
LRGEAAGKKNADIGSCVAVKLVVGGRFMSVFQLDPLTDRRWADLLLQHAWASVFHTPGWLEALRRTYGYKPILFTTSPAGEPLTNGVVFCGVNSWVTGNRLVSLPFSDHCEPLVDSEEQLRAILGSLSHPSVGRHWKYTEIRPLTRGLQGETGFADSESFCFHRLDLRPGIEQVFKGFHKDCVQRKIRKAEREGVTYEGGNSEELLRKFYQLMVLTRRRQQLPPQPLAWFRNLSQTLGDSLKVRVALHERRPVASIITLRFRDTEVYKYGCSDPRFANLGGTQWLFWKTIQEAVGLGLKELDLGRSDWDNPGLITFKDRLGASRQTLTYWRHPKPQPKLESIAWMKRLAGRCIRSAPQPLLAATGRLLYRHFG